MTRHGDHPAHDPIDLSRSGDEAAERDRLDDALEALRAGRPTPTPDTTTDTPSPTVATAEWVHRFADAHVAPRLSDDEATLIWEDLMRTHAAPLSLAATSPPVPTPFPARPRAGSPTLPGATDRHRRARLRLVGATPGGLSAAHPVGQHPTAIARPRRSAWARRGWPVVELLGVAAILLGIVGFIIAGGGGGQPDAPALIPLAAQGTATPEATPDAAPAEVAGLPDRSGTGAMPGPGIDGAPELLWRIPTDAQTGGTFVAADVVVRLGIPTGADLDAPWTLSAVSTRSGTPVWEIDVTAGGLGITGTWGDTIVTTMRSTTLPLQVDGQEVGPADEWSAVGLDAATGDVRWSTPIGVTAPVGSAPATPAATSADGSELAHVITDEGRLIALDPIDGTIAWAVTVSGDSPAPTDAITGEAISDAFFGLTVSDGMVMTVSLLRQTLSAFDAATGERLWDRVLAEQPEPGTPGLSFGGPAIADGRVYLSSSNYNAADGAGEQRLLALDAATGDTVWQRDLEPVDLTGTTSKPSGVGVPVVTADAVVISDYVDDARGLMGFSPETGDELWQRSFGDAGEAQLSFVGDTGYAARRDGLLTAIDLRTGDELWSLTLGGATLGAPWVEGGVIYQAAQDGQLYAIGGTGEPVTDDSTPGAAENISGLPTCDVEPRTVEDALALGADGSTPAATLAEDEYYPGIDGTAGDTLAPSAITWDDVPVGTPADPDTAAAVADTVEAVQACARVRANPGDAGQVATFFSDDFFRRAYNQEILGYGSLLPGSQYVPALTDDIRLLEDGRAFLITTEGQPAGEIGNNQATMYVFAEQPDGTWLIDEVVLVNDSGFPPQG